MPIYEFRCQQCDEDFEKLVRLNGETEITCPNCGSTKAQKKMSTFASRLEGGSYNFSNSSSDCATGST